MHDMLRLAPIFQERVWGGHRLRPDASDPIGEAWVVFEGCKVLDGSWAGSTLGEVAAQSGEALLGADVVAQTGHRFPLLIKLLHSLEWLSVQVHPNDEQALALEGPGHFGKTEAWHIVEADEGAQVVYGLDGNWSGADLERLIALGQFERALNLRDVRAGDTLFTPAGCVHAIGPGLFIYEVQQTSDITYRLFDWNRPASDGRQLHLEKGLSVIGECGQAGSVDPDRSQSPVSTLAQCDYFLLDEIRTTGEYLRMETGGRSFHALTVLEGTASVETEREQITLGSLESVVVPANCGHYSITSEADVRLLCSKVA